jgi:hypothetical protein
MMNRRLLVMLGLAAALPAAGDQKPVAAAS